MIIMDTIMSTIGNKYVGYIKRIMGRQQYSNRYYEYAYVYEAVRVFSNIKGKPKVLDVGSGFSPFTNVLNTISNCCVIDSDKEAIKRQRSLGLKSILSDATKLPFGDDAFDIVTSVSAIEHFGLHNDRVSEDVINADMLAVDEIRRILKSNGLFIFTVPFAKSFFIVRATPPATAHRWYDCNSIKLLISKFGTIKNITYGRYIVRPSSYEYCILNGNPSHIMITVEKGGEDEY